MFTIPKTGYDLIRHKLFNGRLSHSQVNGIEAILTAINQHSLPDKRQVAYMLATAYHETARTMQPIEELGKGRGREYGVAIEGKVYYGRGYVQLTWLYNYKVMGKLLHVNLVKNPALACEPDIAAQIMLQGMTRGLFTGKKLSGYINSLTCDYVNARRIINGLDKATQIAGYARLWESALTWVAVAVVTDADPDAD